MSEYNTPEFTRYAALHQTPNGAGDARPTALQIVQDEGLEGKLAGKVGAYTNLFHQLCCQTLLTRQVLITGCSSGIGIETARAMEATGAHVFATARDLNKGKKALADSTYPVKAIVSSAPAHQSNHRPRTGQARTGTSRSQLSYLRSHLCQILPPKDQ